jgi:hypothetical protein
MIEVIIETHNRSIQLNVTLFRDIQHRRLKRSMLYFAKRLGLFITSQGEFQWILNRWWKLLQSVGNLGHVEGGIDL